MHVSFFAQAIAPKIRIYGSLTDILERLYERGANVFYIGDKGYFYVYVTSALKELKSKHPEIVCREVKSCKSEPDDFCESIYPPEVTDAEESQRQRAQIRWMIDNCDVAVLYKAGVKGYYNRVIKEAEAAGKEIIYIEAQPGK